MAKLAKSQDPTNWRKGAQLATGDLVAIEWDAAGNATAFSAVVSRETVAYMGTTTYKFALANGRSKTAAGREFVQGRYTTAS